MNALIAFEESQEITKAFREKGIEAFSCDLEPCSGGYPQYHFQCDVRDVLDNRWDLMIAHPPCTYLSVSGAKWYYHPDDKDLPYKERRPHPRFPDRAEHREEAVSLFMELTDAPIDHIAIENPVGIMSTRYRKPDQIIQPYQFGEPHAKKTCLWIQGLPLLQPTEEVEPEYVTTKSGKRMPKWYNDAWNLPEHERRKVRSKTFEGVAKAMADQWGDAVEKWKERPKLF